MHQMTSVSDRYNHPIVMYCYCELAACKLVQGKIINLAGVESRFKRTNNQGWRKLSLSQQGKCWQTRRLIAKSNATVSPELLNRKPGRIHIRAREFDGHRIPGRIHKQHFNRKIGF